MPAAIDLTHRKLGKYTCTVRLTAGGFGTIWKAQSGKGKKTVAIKIMNPDLVKSRQAHQAFQREFNLCKKFKHPGLLKYISFDYLDDTPYMVMEYFPSCTLKTGISGDCPFPIKGLIEAIIRNAASALDYVHEQGIIHCDVKPENILVNEEGKTRLIDFSIAQPTGGFSTWLPFLRKVEGTPSYMPPEQIQKKKLTPAADMYAFGATLYEFLTGKPPFVGETQNEVLNKALKATPVSLMKMNDGITVGLDKLVLSMLAKSPDERPRDMKALLRQLDRAGVYRAV